MLKLKFVAFFLILILTTCIYSQSINERYNKLGQMFIEEFSSAPFPHPDRMEGHKYGDEIYSFAEHYNDSSVAIFIPEGFKESYGNNIVVYFHGWRNNIDSACANFKLIEQFSQSGINALFVFPEGPKNAPDSFGGRLEEKDGLKNLLDDVLKFLIEKGKLSSNKIDNIILAGHSGAFNVISFCLMRGGLTDNISDVFLFDALYGQIEKYLYWIENYDGRFINIYTDHGGTKRKSESLMDDFNAWGIKYFQTEETELAASDLTNNRLIFIHSDLVHNEVVSARDQFRDFLMTSKLKVIKK